MNGHNLDKRQEVAPATACWSLVQGCQTQRPFGFQEFIALGLIYFGLRDPGIWSNKLLVDRKKEEERFRERFQKRDRFRKKEEKEEERREEDGKVGERWGGEGKRKGGRREERREEEMRGENSWTLTNYDIQGRMI